MSPPTTTLATFFIENIHATGSVTLYGSWDGFTHGYPMHKDRQAGHGRWHGCFAFKNVVCDGDPSNCTSRRNGALREGGLYWYYYKKDGDVEFHNPFQPSTNRCPLLPGQTVNLWEIPHQTTTPDGQQEPGSYAADYIAMDARDRFPDRLPDQSHKTGPRSVHQPTSEERAARARLFIARTRKEWLATGVGRMQTAVVDQCMMQLPIELSHNGPRIDRRAKTASAADSVGVNLQPPTIDDLRRLPIQLSRSESEPPRSHFGSRAATKRADFRGTALPKEYSNPFLAFSDSHTNAAGRRRPSLIESMRDTTKTTTHSLRHHQSWSEGISDGQRAVRLRVRKLILDRSRPFTAPGRYNPAQPFPGATGRLEDSRAGLSTNPPSTTAQRPRARGRPINAARNPNRISEVPELEAEASNSPPPEHIPDQVLSSEPPSRTASIFSKYSLQGKPVRLSSTRRARLPSLDISSDLRRATSPSASETTSPGWTSPEPADSATPLDSPAGSPAASYPLYATVSSNNDLYTYQHHSAKPCGATVADIPKALASQETIRPPAQSGHARNFSRPSLHRNRSTADSEAVVKLDRAQGGEAHVVEDEFETRLDDIGYLGSVIY